MWMRINCEFCFLVDEFFMAAEIQMRAVKFEARWEFIPIVTINKHSLGDYVPEHYSTTSHKKCTHFHSGSTRKTFFFHVIYSIFAHLHFGSWNSEARIYIRTAFQSGNIGKRAL